MDQTQAAAGQAGAAQGNLRHPMVRALKGLAHPGGRASRSELVRVYLAMVIVTVAIHFVLGTSMSLAPVYGYTRWIFAAYAPILLIAAIRRLHDSDRNGWWALFIIVPLALNLWHDIRIAAWQDQVAATQILTPMPDAPLWTTLVALPAVLGMLVLLFWPGTPGPNRFGPAPLGKTAQGEPQAI